MTVAIIGLGLIGGSVGLGLGRWGFAERIVGYDSCEHSLDRALVRKAVQTTFRHPAEVANSKLWVLAVPPSAVPATLQWIQPHLRPDAVVTDCASVKESVLESVPQAMVPRFVGGHPMAGRETSGIDSARPDLFESASWVLCPQEATDRDAVNTARQMAYALDAVPVIMSAQDHDRHVAVLSHLPHVLAAALVDLADDLKTTDISAGSWDDLTRVAGSHPELWSAIALGNREALIAAIQDCRGRLDRFEALLTSLDSDGIRETFERARLQKAAQTRAAARRGQE